MQIKKKWFIDKKTTVGFGLALSIMLGIGGFSYLNFFNLKKTTDRVEHTYEVLETNENILVLLINAETGQRGYLIAGEDRYLQPYHIAIERVDQEIKELRLLTSDNPNQKRRLDTLEHLIMANFAELKQTIDLRQNIGLEAALQVVKTNRGQQLMDEIRKLNQEIATEENQLLQERSQQQLAIAQDTTFLTIIGSIVVFGLVLRALDLVNRDIIWRKRAADALRESKERYRAFITQSSEGIWRFELEEPLATECLEDEQIQHFYQYGYLAECNNVMAQMYGFSSAQEIVGVRLADLLVDSEPLNVEYLRSFIRSGYKLNAAESYELDKQGESKYFLNSLVGIVENGSLIRAWGSQLDITARKQLEDALKQKSIEREVLLNSIPALVYYKDRASTYIAVNQTFADIINTPIEEIPGKTDFDFFPLEQAAAFRKDDCEVMKSGDRRWNIEEPLTGADGKTIWATTSKTPYRNSCGEITGMVGITIDITERKLIEEALRERETRYRLVARATNDAIWDWDLVTNQVEWNEGVETLLGYWATEVGSDPTWWYECIHPDDRERVVSGIHQAIASGGQIWTAEYRYLRADNSYGLVIDRGFVAYDASGKPVRMIGSIMDITERKRAEVEREQLLAREQKARIEAERANRMKDEFLATLSHELRTPLNAMTGWTQLLRTRKFDEKTTARALETIDRNTKSLAQLIEDVLDVSRIITGKLRLNMSPVELGAVIESAIETVLPAAEAKNIQLKFRLDSAIGSVLGDANRLQQVFCNLLANAVKFTPKGGRVEVRLEVINSRMQIRVSDTGLGIAPEFLPYVFERFRQADSTTTRSYGGLGLGLAIVRHLVELHGGTVHAESLGAGQGATFIVNLPLRAVRLDVSKPIQVKAAVTEEVPTISCLRSLADLRILVVDDESDARELLTTVLGEYGAEVIAVATVGEALDVIKHLQPNVLVSDIGMPEEDGYALIGKVRALDAEQGGRIPAIALTAYARAEDQTQALLAGFQQHVPKPVDPAELVIVVASLTERTR